MSKTRIAPASALADLAHIRGAARHTFGSGLVGKLQMEDELFRKFNDYHHSADCLASDVLLGHDELLAPAKCFFTAPLDRERELELGAGSRARLEKRALSKF